MPEIVESEIHKPGQLSRSKAIMTNQYAAQSLAEFITPKQLVAILSIGTSKGINVESEARRIYGCKADSLNIRTTSNFITYLSAQPRRWITTAACAA